MMKQKEAKKVRCNNCNHGNVTFTSTKTCKSFPDKKGEIETNTLRAATLCTECVTHLKKRDASVGMRLTAFMRMEIVDRVMKGAFVEEKAKLKARSDDVCAEAYAHIMPNVDDKLLRSMAKRYPGMVKMHDEFCFDTGEDCVYVSTSHEYPGPFTSHNIEVNTHKDAPIWAKAKSIEKDRKKMNDKRDELRDDVRLALNCHKSVETMLKSLPQFEPFIDAEWKGEQKKQLPVPKFEALLDRLARSGAIK